jgi:hypothetical protein
MDSHAAREPSLAQNRPAGSGTGFADIAAP